MKIERINDDSKMKKIVDLCVGDCFLYSDEDTISIKTDESDDHSCETLCVDLRTGTTFMAVNSSLVIPVSAKVVIEV